MNKTIFADFPDSFNVNTASLHKVPKIKNFEDFVFLANKYRNIFRNNFLTKDYISYEQSHLFFTNLNKDYSRILYAICFEEKWVGHFGLRNLGNKNIMLDNALRFSAQGGSSLFKDINHALIKSIKFYLPNHNILIIVKKDNINALQLHEDMNFNDCSQYYYDNLSIDSKNYSIMILK